MSQENVDVRSENKAREQMISGAVLVVGMALGWVDLVTPETGGSLRVPALIAALFLVGSALNVFLPIGAKGHVEEEPAVESGLERPGAATMGGRQMSEPPPPVRTSPTVALGLMALAVWLGLATLTNSEAPWQLLLLSLVAAFLIFARGLAELPGG
jgi:hypothetical protein